MSDSSETTELSGSVESTASTESTSTSNTDSTSPTPGDETHHHDIPHRSVRDKLCDFYMSAKGCIKGDACDFHHPRAPNGAITNRVCEYYLQPRGCVKGDDCDFLHPQQRLRQGIRGGVATGYKSTRPCEFFFSNRGCVKGDDCDYSHINMTYMNGPNPYYRGPPMRYPPGPYPPRYPYMGMGMPMMPHAPHGHIPPHIAMGIPPQRPQPCSFFNTEKGCIKGMHCDFIHQKNTACDFFHSERGCRKGKYCDYLHSFDGQPTHVHNSITRPIPVTGYYGNPYAHDIQTSPVTSTSTEHAQAHNGNTSQAVAVEAAS